MYNLTAFRLTFASVAALSAGLAVAAPSTTSRIDAMAPGHPVLLPYSIAFQNGATAIRCGEVSLSVAVGQPACVHRLTAMDIHELRSVAARPLADGAGLPVSLPSGVAMTLARGRDNAPGVVAMDLGGEPVALGSTTSMVNFTRVTNAVSDDIALTGDDRRVWLRLYDSRSGAPAATTAALGLNAGANSGLGLGGGANVGIDAGASGIGASVDADAGGISGGISADADTGGISASADADAGGIGGGIGADADTGGVSASADADTGGLGGGIGGGLGGIGVDVGVDVGG